MEIRGQHRKTHKPQVCPCNDNNVVNDLCNTTRALTVHKKSIFGIFPLSSGSVRANFGSNGHEVTMLVPSKASKQFIID